MKTINFTAKEVLPSLLDESKCQTIRKAWKEDISTEGIPMDYGFDKPAKYSVGEKVKIVWDEENKESIEGYFSLNGHPCGGAKRIWDQNYHKNVFNKHLGVVEITEVFQIEMFRFESEPDSVCCRFPSNNKNITDKDINEIVKLDGFNSFKDMMDYFIKNYIPKENYSAKRFWVYRWRWL